MVVTSLPAARKAGYQAGMHRRAVEPDRAGAAIARVAALLDAEDAAVAQECAQALAGRGSARTSCRRPRSSCAVSRLGASSCADLLGEVVGQVALVGGRCRARRRNSRRPGCARRSPGAAPSAVGGVLEAQLHRPRRRGGDGEQQVAGRSSLRADQQRRRAAEMGERGTPESEPLRQGRGRNVDGCAAARPAARTLAWLPVTKSTAGTSRGAPSRGQSV